MDYSGTGSTVFSGADWTAANPWCNFSTAELFVGDFNLDGRSDLLCHARDTGFLWIDFASTSGQYAGTDWSTSTNVFCFGSNQRMTVGDTNADGRTDLICHNQSTGGVQVSFAQSGGGFTGISWQNASLAFCTGANRVVSAGDYNGDGRSDLLCTNTSTNSTQGSLWALAPTQVGPPGSVYVNDSTNFPGYQFGWGPLRIRRISPAQPWSRR